MRNVVCLDKNYLIYILIESTKHEEILAKLKVLGVISAHFSSAEAPVFKNKGFLSPLLYERWK